MSNTDPVALIGDINAAVEGMKATNAQMNDSLTGLINQNSDDVKSAVAKGEALAEQMSGFSNQIIELEQKLGESVIKGKAPVESLGQMVIKSEGFKQFASGESQKMRVQANTITGQEGSPPVNSDTLVGEQRVPGIISGAYRSLRLRDLLPQAVTASNAVTFVRETAFTNNAAETAEGAQKPESVLTFENVTVPIATIAHTIKVSKQVLDDAPMLAAYIDQRMRYGVELRYDAQLLNGNGTGQNISGILDSGNFTAFTPTSGENALDGINRAIQAAAVADYPATGIVLSPEDWHGIERIKRGTSDVQYVIGDPSGRMGPTLWGLPVVVTNQLAAGTFIVGAFDMAYMVWNRMGTVVEVFNQNEDDVEKNLLTVRAENRGALASMVPAAIQSGSLTV